MTRDEQALELLERDKKFPTSYGTAIADRFRDRENGEDVFLVHTVETADGRLCACDFTVSAAADTPSDVLTETMGKVITQVIEDGDDEHGERGRQTLKKRLADGNGVGQLLKLMRDRERERAEQSEDYPTDISDAERAEGFGEGEIKNPFPYGPKGFFAAILKLPGGKLIAVKAANPSGRAYYTIHRADTHRPAGVLHPPASTLSELRQRYPRGN